MKFFYFEFKKLNFFVKFILQFIIIHKEKENRTNNFRGFYQIEMHAKRKKLYVCKNPLPVRYSTASCRLIYFNVMRHSLLNRFKPH